MVAQPTNRRILLVAFLSCIAGAFFNEIFMVFVANGKAVLTSSLVVNLVPQTEPSVASAVEEQTTDVRHASQSLKSQQLSTSIERPSSVRAAAAKNSTHIFERIAHTTDVSAEHGVTPLPLPVPPPVPPATALEKLVNNEPRATDYPEDPPSNTEPMSEDVRILGDVCEPVGLQMHQATGERWPAKRACLSRDRDRRCAVKFTGGPPDGFGSQIYKRMATFQDAAQFSCAYVPSALATKTDRDSKLFRLVAHGVEPRDVDRSFGLTSSVPQVLAATERAFAKGLRPFCPSLKAKALVHPEKGVQNTLAFRNNMAGAYCKSKAPLLRYTVAGFNRTLWLQGRAALRDLYVGSPGPASKRLKPLSGTLPDTLPHHEAFRHLLGSSAALEERQRKGELLVVAHVRRGDVDQNHIRFVPLKEWKRALSSVVEAAAEAVLLQRRRGGGGTPPHSPQGAWQGAPSLSNISVHIFTERKSDAEPKPQWLSAVAEANLRCGGCVSVETHGGNGQGPLADFSALVEADVLLVSDSAFALAAAQLTLGLVCRLGRAGFAERDVHWFLPLPLDWKLGEPVEPGPNRQLTPEESSLSEQELLLKSPARFKCRLAALLDWRSGFSKKLRWWDEKKANFDLPTPVCT